MSAEPRTDWHSWWQLLRAANVFTAASNVIAGFLLVQHEWQPIVPLLLLILTSVLLYEGGMVLNDVCDADLDAIERPERPIPSGRVSKGHAYIVAVVLLVSGLLSATFAMAAGDAGESLGVASALATAVVAYNCFAKSTPLGPVVMGSCRTLNVLLGASIVDLAQQTTVWLYAMAIGIYTVALTLLARSENLDPSGQVKRHVGTLIQLFIVFDAVVSTLAAGWVSGLVVLSLIVPTRLLARKLPMT